MPSDTFEQARNHAPACFAPPLDDEALIRYESLANVATPPVRDAMVELINMVRLFHMTPESSLPGEPLQTEYTRNPFHDAQGNRVPPPKKIPLEEAEIARIWDAVPYEHELQAMANLFEQIDAQANAPLRNAAFHLLWYGRELFLDREPMTNDKIGR